MTNIFANALKNEAAWTRTENGAVAKNTSGDGLVDLFGTIGSLRSADNLRIERLFEEAYKEDPLIATKILFYARDVREGLGERKTFRHLINYISDNYPEALKENIPLIQFFGRWDDLYCIMGTQLEDDMWQVMKDQFTNDIHNMEAGDTVSLLAKWIKTPDASSKKTRALGIMTAKKLGYSVYDFKRILRRLRKYIDVTEVKMSANEWDQISYPAVPSKAMTNYRHAFSRHDGDRFGEYLSKVTKGEEKINASTLYPYDLIEKIFMYNIWRNGDMIKTDPIVEAQWKALPNYVEPGTNAIVIADTSGSMHGRPMNSALGLAIYFAERNTGAYHNLFMSFSERSTVHEIKGENLAQKLQSIDMRDWGNNTNLHAAFKHVLDIAKDNKIPQDEMVKSIIVISDMEIDWCSDDDWTFYDQMRDEYSKAGYEIPNVIFWNVNSRNDVFHADANRKGVQLVSGQSASIFKQLVGAISMTPYELMMKVIGSERYDCITVEES